MPRTCSICSHEQRSTIDAELVAGTSSYRNIAGRFGVSLGALTRHKEHLKAELAAASEERQTEALDHLARLESLLEQAESLMTEATKAERFSAAVSAIREARACLSLWREWQPSPEPTIPLHLVSNLVRAGYAESAGGVGVDQTRLEALLTDLAQQTTGNAAAEATLESLAGVLWEGLDDESTSSVA